MPRKIREFKAQIVREGFIYLPKRGKGSHERWQHPLIKKTLTIPGKDGDDVPIYLEKQLTKILIELQQSKENEDS
jgi:predicted RNA binding protein YcfA (HicA-like mRNA interferase family)